MDTRKHMHAFGVAPSALMPTSRLTKTTAMASAEAKAQAGADIEAKTIRATISHMNEWLWWP